MEESESKRTTRRVVRTTRRVISKRTPDGKTDVPLSLPSWVKLLLQFLMVEVPLSFLFLLFLLVNALLYLNTTLWFPIMQINQWTLERAETELTHYDMNCDARTVVTATNYTSLILSPTVSTQAKIRESVSTVRKHGGGIITNLFDNVSPADSIQRFRSYALRKNQVVGNDEDNANVDVVGVIENNHRWSFAFGVEEDPSIAPLLEAIGRHKVLLTTLEGLLGPNPAIVELSTITAEEGAIAQGWHFDTTQAGDSLKFADTFSDLYSLLIPMQDTTSDMGPTAICPGTHYCSHTLECDEVGFSPLSSSGGNTVWKAGDGLLFNSHLNHQGTAHIKGPTRVAMVISFVSSRGNSNNDNLLPPLAAGYVIPWTSMGFTFNDLAEAGTSMVPPKSTLRTLGLTSGSAGTRTSPPTRGWDYFSFCAAHMGNPRDPPLVVMMPYIKHLPLALVGQAKNHETFSPWQVFILDTLWRVWATLMALTIFGWLSYLYVLSNVQSSDMMKSSSTKPTVCLSMVLRLFLLHGAMLALVLWLVQHYYSEHSGATPKTHRSSYAKVTEKYIQNLASPQTHDIMMGPHFLDDAFQWIPGNRRWHDAAQSMLPWYLASLGQSTVFSNAIIATILDEATSHGSHSVMMQNDQADWVELDTVQANEQTRMWMDRLLISSPNARHPCQKRSTRSTALCRGMLDIDFIFSRTTISKEETERPISRQTWRPRKLLVLPSLCRTSTIGLLTNTEHAENATHNNNTQTQSFEVGESVEARIRPTTRKWLRATVTDKHSRHNDEINATYIVQFDVDLPEYQLENPIPASLLRKVKPRCNAVSNDKNGLFVRRTVASQRI